MKIQKNKTILLFATLYVNLVVCIAGSIFGTYAWYQYSSRASVLYEGTAVNKGNDIKIGLVSDELIPDFEAKYELTLDDYSIEGKYIYWGANNFTKELIGDYEEAMGYSRYGIGPCSSGAYETGEEFRLKKSPVYLLNEEDRDAYKTSYSFLRLAFKDNTASGNIYLVGSEIECPNNIDKCFRTCFVNPYDASKTFIYNPSSKVDGTNDVAGILNLNADNFYDYDDDTGAEHLYGEYDDAFYVDAYDGEENLVPEDKITTFAANHKKGIRQILYVPKKTHYLGTDSVLSKRPVTYRYEGSNISLLDVTIYLEGWDENCVEYYDDYEYNLTLEFSVIDD